MPRDLGAGGAITIAQFRLRYTPGVSCQKRQDRLKKLFFPLFFGL